MCFQSKLEKTIDAAIASQDFDTAEKLSDQLATREVMYLFLRAIPC